MMVLLFTRGRLTWNQTVRPTAKNLRHHRRARYVLLIFSTVQSFWCGGGAVAIGSLLLRHRCTD